MAYKKPFRKKTVRAQVGGIALTKAHGQNFLQDLQYVERSVAHLPLSGANILEIGPGSGALTTYLLQHDITQLCAVEIDERWVAYLRTNMQDQRFALLEGDIAKMQWETIVGDKKWFLIANLPYHVTFPILYALQAHRSHIPQAVIMIQEEVAQKLVKTSGRNYGYISLFFQWYFTMELQEKVPPTAFNPPPKVTSRLISLAAKFPEPIVQETEFWQFIKRCFSQPRRTLLNNLKPFHYDLSRIEERYLSLRAQQLGMSDLLNIWRCLAGE